APAQPSTPAAASAPQEKAEQAAPSPAAPPAAPAAAIDEPAFRKAHASPAVRAFARELGVDLSRIKGSGPKERIVKDDVQNFVKSALAGGAPAAASAGGGAVTGGGVLNLLPWPTVDFAKFGPVESKPLSRIKKIS